MDSLQKCFSRTLESRNEDLLERNPEVVLNQAMINELVTVQNLAQMQADCPDIGRFVKYLQTGELPEDATIARQTVFESENYFLKEGVLHHHYQPTNKHVDEVKPLIKQVVIPISLRQSVLEEFHDQNAHPGIDRCYLALREKFFWPKLYKDVREYCSSCYICRTSKIKTHFKRAFNPLPITRPFARYSIDFIGPITETPEGYKHILLVVETFSRWPEAFPLKTQHAS